MPFHAFQGAPEMREIDMSNLCHFSSISQGPPSLPFHVVVIPCLSSSSPPCRHHLSPVVTISSLSSSFLACRHLPIPVVVIVIVPHPSSSSFVRHHHPLPRHPPSSSYPPCYYRPDLAHTPLESPGSSSAFKGSALEKLKPGRQWGLTLSSAWLKAQATPRAESGGKCGRWQA